MRRAREALDIVVQASCLLVFSIPGGQDACTTIMLTPLN